MFPQKQRFFFILLLCSLVIFSLGALCSPPAQLGEKPRESPLQEDIRTERYTRAKDASAQELGSTIESELSEHSNATEHLHQEEKAPKEELPNPICQKYPKGPYGTKVSETVEAFDPPLKNCDLESVTLQKVACEASLLLISVGAGWCAPCIEESKVVEKHTYQPFKKRGLRVVQILFQDERSQRPTSLFCAKWKKQFGLTFPVLIDPIQQTRKWFNYQTGTPLHLLVDPRRMKVLFRWSGSVPKGLNQQIESTLQRMGR